MSAQFVGPLVDRQGRFGCLIVAVAVSRCVDAMATYYAAIVGFYFKFIS